MKKTATLCRRGLAGALATALLATTLTGCGGIEDVTNKIMSLAGDYLTVTPGQTVSEDSKWVNSSVDGSLDETVPTNEKDDFFTAVNRDWLLDTELDENGTGTNPFVESGDKLNDRLVSILLGTPDEQADLANELPGLTSAQVDHDLALVHAFAGLAGDDAAREAAGVEPARPYVEAIESITNLQQLSAFLCNEDGKNIALQSLIPFDVTVPYTERTAYVVTVGDTPALTLRDPQLYRMLNKTAGFEKNLALQKATYLLGRLGRTDAEVDALLHRCLNLEQKLAHSLYDDSMNTESDAAMLYEMRDNNFTKAELSELQGNYPLVEMLDSYGMADTDRYIVAQPDYVRAVSSLYTQENLEDIKAYLLVHSVGTLLPLLDAESVELAAYNGGALGETATPETANPDPIPDADTGAEDAQDDPATAAAKDMISNYIEAYLSDPLQQIYVARYCTAEQKTRLQTMVDDLMTAYHAMLKSEEWMSEETCAKAIEKLDNMAVRNLYPDDFTDYTALDLAGADNLVEAVAAINRFEKCKQNVLIGQPIGSSYWDMARMPTIMVNAMYSPEENSINLLAGLFSSDFFYSDAMTDEQLLGRAGAVIGHEISHAFDSTGSQYDSAGYKTNWWTTEDYDRYMVRTGHLKKSYNTQFLAPGLSASSYGDNVNGEAVADMAGVKVALLVAKDKPGFDYKDFFTAYAQMWRSKYPYNYLLMVMRDVHPLGFLRANKTLQQFDEFLAAYNLAPGDGMYLAPEDRITVW